MKTLFRSPFVRLPLALGLLALAVLSPAQGGSHQGPDTPEERARLLQDKPKSDLATKLQGEAMAALRTHRYADAERLASHSAALFESTLFPELSLGDHQILAESYVARKRYDLALAEALPWKGNAETGRFGATKALALLGLGRKDEARRLLLDMVGTAEAPGWDRPSLPLPIEDDPSDGALLATAYVVRTDGRLGLRQPEVYDDLKAAERLAPRNPCVVNGLAFYLADAKRFEEARVYYARAASINEPKIRKLGEQGVTRMDRAIFERDKAKVDGVKVP